MDLNSPLLPKQWNKIISKSYHVFSYEIESTETTALSFFLHISNVRRHQNLHMKKWHKNMSCNFISHGKGVMVLFLR